MQENIVYAYGLAAYTERVTSWTFELNISVDGPANSPVLAESRQLAITALKTLLANGLSPEQVYDAGSRSHSPFRHEEKPGIPDIHINHCIQITTDNRETLLRAAQATEAALSGTPAVVTLSEQDPTYSPDPEDITLARRSAVERAKEKATIVAEHLKLTLGQSVYIEESRDDGRYELVGAGSEEETPATKIGARQVKVSYKPGFRI